ncbi:pentapeptide repeat-containing protein [Saccharopolyspora sp. K220]|uniref:pentapeptide repeat-containing protein n=1 Tax=Saccharopolyspora soli TaxID=2926618 RepID=UPI001F572F7E|nr:pentapeptide repeat-containing protein [Saccharopolyspora soli]MCI2419658.1 pentapeptide repeat-containing protein [Saccharopolyspora soli]
MGERKIGLVATIALAVVVLVCVSAALLAFDPRTTGADALRTGGLAAGSVVALYALWLNDRRRRVEEQRQELETRRQELDRQRYALERQRQALEDRRTDQDRDRAADERFARAVELLGNEADQVRVGAMHALAGLAGNHPEYTQTVLDVLCSYLRRPFDHPKWIPQETLSPNPDQWPEISPELERERYVRQTAQRLIRDLLPATDVPDPVSYRLDLTRAALERFNLSDRVVGRIAAYRCRFRYTTNLNRAVFHGPVHFRDSVFLGRIRAEDTLFHDKLELRGMHTHGPCGFERARFEGEVDVKRVVCREGVYFTDAVCGAGLDLRHAHFDGGVNLRLREPLPSVSLYDTEVGTSVLAEVPEGWALEPLPSTNRARIRVHPIEQDFAHG